MNRSHQTQITDQLRLWSHGMYTTEAATELLIRARNGTFAAIDRPWIKPTDQAHWIDFPAITEHLDELSVENSGCCGSPLPSAPTRQPR